MSTSRTVAFMVGVALALPAAAQISVWVSPDGAWFESANWQGGVPSENAARIDNGGVARLGQGDASVSAMFLGALAGSSGSLVQTGGTLSSSSSFVMARYPGSSGAYSISNAVGTFAGGLGVGQEGDAQMHAAGGARVHVHGILVVGGQRAFALEAETFGSGMLDVAGAGTLVEVEPGSSQAGIIEIGGGGAGRVTVRGGATLRAGAVVVLALTEDGSELAVTGDGSLLEITGADAPHGFLDLGYASGAFPLLPTPNAAAVLTIGPGARVRSEAEVRIAAGGLVRADARLDAHVRNIAGVVRPGIGGVGALEITGVFDQTGDPRGDFEGGALEIDIAGDRAGEYDVLTVAAALLGGMLRVSLLGAFTPELGARFEIVRCVEPGLVMPADVGRFQELDLPGLAEGRAWSVDVEPAGVALRVAPASGCPADLAEPYGSLDIADAIAFLDAFGAARTPADFEPPFGVYDFSDAAAFMNAFALGCP